MNELYIVILCLRVVWNSTTAHERRRSWKHIEWTESNDKPNSSN